MISMYAKGMTTRQISETIEDIYGFETSSQALLKALYLATFEATKKWTMPIRNWGKVRGELTIMYPDRIPD